jgi:hypothetical protein
MPIARRRVAIWRVGDRARRPGGDTDRARKDGSIIVTISGRIAPA